MNEIAQIPLLFEGHRETSKRAARSMVPHVERLERRVWDAIHVAAGLTSDEVEVQLALPHQTVSARIHSLMRRGNLRDSGRRRPTRSGRQAIVWEAVLLTPTEPHGLTRMDALLLALTALDEIAQAPCLCDPKSVVAVTGRDCASCIASRAADRVRKVAKW